MDDFKVKCFTCSRGRADPVMIAVRDFQYHNSTKHPNNAVICHDCPNVLFNHDQLEDHFEDAHADKTHQICLQCLVKPGMEYYLAEWDFPSHYSGVHKEATRKCSRCGNRFEQISVRDGHLKKWHHSDPEPPKIYCPHPNCDKTADKKSDMLRHTKSAHPRNSHICPNCNGGFRYKGDLDVHLPECNNIKYS